MKNYRLLLISVCFTVAGIGSVFAQDMVVVDMQSYIVETYSATPVQAAKYVEALTKKHTKEQSINATTRNANERNSELSSIFKDFRNSVSRIFSEQQYEAWLDNTEGQDKIRILREDYGLSTLQVRLLHDLEYDLKKGREALWEEVLPYAERLELDTKLTIDFETDVADLIGTAPAKQYLDGQKLDAQAVKLMRRYGNISYNTGFAIAGYCLEYDIEKARITESTTSRTAKAAQINELNQSTKEKVKASLPAEAYAKWKIFDDPSVERRQTLIHIRNVEFANMKKDGKIIDNYGEMIMGETVKYLTQRIEYQAKLPGETVTLNVKLIDPYGNVLRKASSPDGFSYSTTFITSEGDELQTIEIGKWKGRFGKNYRIEIYDDVNLVYRGKIPTRGQISHVPIVSRTGAPVSRELQIQMSNRVCYTRPRVRFPRASRYEILYRQGFTGYYNDYYYIEGWREVEK